MIPPLFQGLFDDAALFPPGNASMPAAVTAHQQYLLAGADWLVGRFVCPADRLAELAAELRQQDAGPLAVSITAPGGLAALATGLSLAATLDRIEPRQVELPVPAAELAASVDRLAALAATGLAVYAELPAAQLSPAGLHSLAAAGIGLKLRTGGATAAAVPSPAELGRAFELAVEAGVPVKCTAGLHHAISHRDPADGAFQHGFINVLLAIQAAQAGGDPVAVLASEAGSELAARAAELTELQVSGVRRQFHSIGSCSIDEPLTDLENLGLVTAA